MFIYTNNEQSSGSRLPLSHKLVFIYLYISFLIFYSRDKKLSKKTDSIPAGEIIPWPEIWYFHMSLGIIRGTWYDQNMASLKDDI